MAKKKTETEDEEEEEETEQQEEEEEKKKPKNKKEETKKKKKEEVKEEQKVANPKQPYSFTLAKRNDEAFLNFIQQLSICGKNTDLFMHPLPLELGQLRFSIERHRAGFNRIHPSYYLYLEKPSGGHV